MPGIQKESNTGVHSLLRQSSFLGWPELGISIELQLELGKMKDSPPHAEKFYANWSILVGGYIIENHATNLHGIHGAASRGQNRAQDEKITKKNKNSKNKKSTTVVKRFEPLNMTDPGYNMSGGGQRCLNALPAGISLQQR